MKLRTRRNPRVAPLLLVTTLPAASLGLLSLSCCSILAQTTNASARSARADRTLALGVPDVVTEGKSPAQAAPDPKSAKDTTPAAPAQPASMDAAAQPASKDAAAQPAPSDAAAQPAPSDAAAQPAPAAPIGSTISEIDVENNKLLSKDYIIAASGHKVGDPCNQQTLTEMKTKLYDTGYFGMHEADPDDAVKVHSEEANGKCRVVIEVDENEAIKGITISGAGPIKPEEIRKVLHLKEGVVYNLAQFGRDAHDIEEMYRNRGYIMVFNQDSGIDDKGFLNVDILVTRVTSIKVVKNHKTKAKVILREMRTKVGDYYNNDTLQKDRVRLYNLQLFDEVTPAEVFPGPGQVELTINVVEKRTGTIAVGVGYSNRQQLVGRAEVTETDFRGLGETVNLLWETGGIVNSNSVELGFTEPYLDRHRSALSVQLYDKIVYRFSNSLTSVVNTNTNSTTDNTYHEQRTGGTFTFSRPFGETIRGAGTLRIESVRTDALNLDPASASIVQDGPIYSLGSSIIRNTRDLDLDPIVGAYQIFNVQAGYAHLKAPSNLIVANGIYGDVTFGKGSLEWRQYISPTGPRHRNKPDEDKSTFAIRAILGSSSGTLPFFEQFFVGGAETLRGYREDRFWGSNYFLSSVEFRQPLARKLKGVIFVDSGDAWGGKYSNVNISGFSQGNFKPHFGVGLGIRVGTPLGPIRLDYGIGDEGGRTHFSIGNVF